MKKIYTLAIAFAVAISSIGAKDLSEARIYLNPGHGSWGPNDRPMATIPYPNLAATSMPDTCGFYESNTNLWKVLKLGSKLEQLGAKKENIMYSRVKNGPFPYVKGAENESQFNRSLAEICEEVEANNMDFFLSVHSNAASEGTSTNFPLFLYRGKDGKGNEYQPGSYDQCEIAWPLLCSNQLDPISAYGATSANIRGDVDFYGSESGRTDPNTGKTYKGYLGVLKHGAPGFLSEGYFHTYQPARHRALNQDYCGQEGVRYARGVAKYFGSVGEKTGYIMGTVKDLHEKIVNNLFKYTAKTNDQWLPINGSTVNLLKDGKIVKTYTVDNNYNGVFVFEDLEPGNYTIDCSAEGYKPLADEYKANIEVKANETSYTMVYLESTTYTPPTVIYYNYPDPIQPAYLQVPSELNMQEVASNSYSEITGTVKRAIQRGDSTIILTHNDGVPAIYLVNNKTNKVERQISTEGLVQKEGDDLGFISSLSDIAVTADNKLIGCNSVRCQFSGDQVDAGYSRGTLQFYKWDNFEAAPTKWVSTQSAANYYRADTGHTLTVSGTVDDCKIITSGVTSGTSRSIRWLSLEVVNNTVSSTMFLNKTIDATSNFTCTKLGDDFEIMISPRDNSNVIVDGSLTAPFEFKLANADNTDCDVVGRLADDMIGLRGVGANYFKYAKHALMTAPLANDNGQNIGVKLFDITNGLDNAKLIKMTNAEWATKDIAFASAGAVVNNEDISIYLAQDNAITKLSTVGVEQPKFVNIYATNLKFTDNGESYTFTFNSNDNAQEAFITFFDAENAEVKSIEIPNVVKGENTVSVLKSDLPKQEMTWAIKLNSKTNSTIALLNDRSETFLNGSGSIAGRGVAIDKSPESDFFGRYYIAERQATNNCAVNAYNFDNTKVGRYQGRNSQFGSISRIGIDSKGTVYISDWSDPKSGIWLVDPANLDAEYPNLFNSTRDSNGLFKIGSSAIGGSTPSVSLIGEGENTVLYSYSEDLGPNGNNIAIYNIGTKTEVTTAPDKMYIIGDLQANTNGNVIPDKTGGCWVSQVRSSGNNAAGVPSLIYVNSEGNVVYNSGSSLSEILLGSVNGGFEISPDGKTLVINHSDSQLYFFDLAWNAGTPILTYKYSYKNEDSAYQMGWDFAGNLFTIGKYISIYAFPSESNESITPAKKSLIVKGSASGVEENIADNLDAITVYPNPASDIINIKSDVEIESVDVYSSTGALVARSNSTTVDISHLSAGIYYVRINNQKTISLIKK
ncbi:MAG: T9SS type A sorting domain-containing protein [Muribaculaceae bacterium]|nr:T9SS type A sorting domain-containing protein [Muribaculaceae bacterium]